MTEDNCRINAQAEIRKGNHSLRAADSLLELGLYDDALSRLYYAAFHFASAVLATLGIDGTTHRGLLTLVALHLVKPGLLDAESGRILASLMSLRHQADYNRHFEFDEAGATQERARAEHLLDALKRFLAGRGLDVSA